MPREETPAYVRGAECMIVRAAANLWLWANYLANWRKVPRNRPESEALPTHCTYYVYPKDLEQGGPMAMNGYRVKVTFELEEDQSLPPEMRK